MKLQQITKRFLNLFKLGEVNPVQDEKLIFKILLATERGAIVVVAIVSGIAVAAYGYLLASSYTELEGVRWTTALLMFGLATAITDVGVKFFIQKGAYDFFAAFNPDTYKASSFNWFQRVMQIVGWLCMVGLIAGMFVFDYVSTDSVRKPVANMVRKESKLNQDSISNLVLARENVRVGATKEAIAQIAFDIRQIDKRIAAENIRVSASNRDLKKLVDKGNGWAIGQVKVKQANATAPIREERNQQAALKLDLEKQYAKDLAQKSNVIAASDSATLATNTQIETRNNDLVAGTSTMFIWLGFWCKCIAGLIRIMLVVLFLASNQVDANHDGKIDHRDVTAAAEQGFLAG